MKLAENQASAGRSPDEEVSCARTGSRVYRRDRSEECWVGGLRHRLEFFDYTSEEPPESHFTSKPELVQTAFLRAADTNSTFPGNPENHSPKTEKHQ